MRAGLRVVGLLAIVGATARLVVMERRAHRDALDWQKIAENYKWKLGEHGKSWCKPMVECQHTYGTVMPNGSLWCNRCGVQIKEELGG